MKIVFICFYDAGGQNELLRKAVNKYTPHTARSIVCQQFYLDYPIDIFYPLADINEMVKALSEADFFCFQEGIVDFNEFNVSAQLTPTNHLIRWIGSIARENLAPILLDNLREKTPLQLTTTDWTVASKVGYSFYMPLSIDLDKLPRARKKRKRSKVRIIHTPTARSLKKTEFFLQVMDSLEDKYPVETVLVEGKSWKETLKIRAKCDISFDQLGFAGGWGHSSVEAMALGMPVLCGLNSYVKAMHPDCPVISVTEKTLKDRIIKLVQDEELRKRLGRRGIEYVKRVHDVKKVVHRWIHMIEYVRNGKNPAKLEVFPMEE